MVANHVRLAPWASCIAALLIAVCLTGWSSSTLYAQSAAPAPSDAVTSEAVPAEGDDVCVSCHADESAAWEASPHGDGEGGGASCVACHGEYVKGHPAEGPMSLKVDSSSCEGCHAKTFDQWSESHHAAEGVQCISCHKPHSQELRLTDETLCESCHRESVEDPFHTAHWEGDVTCTSCHLSDAPHTGAVASGDAAIGLAMAPTHDFTTVSSAKCLDCHREAVTQTTTEPTTVAASLPLTTTDAASSEPTPLATATLSAANLGFGLGIGGILGIVFMLIAATYGFGKK